MNTATRRVCLALLALYGATGLWGYFAPRSWYDSFPGFGMRWLPMMGPYNEHFVKDVSAMYLALGVLALITIRWAANNSLVYTLGATWLTFNVLHLIYHLQRLAMFPPGQRAIGAVSLCVVLVLSLLLLIPVRKKPEPVEGVAA